MADRILTWYVDGNIARTKEQVGGTHKLDADYEATEVFMSVRVAGKGTLPLVLDVLDDGVSIFDYKPAIPPYQTDKTWTTIPSKVLMEGSIIRLDVVGTMDGESPRDLTVELFLTRK